MVESSAEGFYDYVSEVDIIGIGQPCTFGEVNLHQYLRVERFMYFQKCSAFDDKFPLFIAF